MTTSNLNLGKPLNTLTHTVGVFSVTVTVYVCGCIRVTILNPKDKDYMREEYSYCRNHGGSHSRGLPLAGQLDMFGPVIKKKKANK